MSDLRSVLHRVVDSNWLADEMSAIGIVGLVDLDGSNFGSVNDLVAVAEAVLPRRE
jgi:hypothetical protein